MDWKKQCAVVIPCLNEESCVASVVTAVRARLPKIIVVDDGSSDRTSNIAGSAGALIVQHDRPQGKGAALVAGWRRAQSLGASWVLSMDGDGQHAPEDIPRFLEAAEHTAAALVVGNRMADPRGMPWLRRQVNRWMSRQLSGTAGCPLPDTQCGYRLMRLDAWSKLPLHTSHFEMESELLLFFARAGERIEFVPIRVIYRDERSKIRPLQDTVRWFRWWRSVRTGAASP